MLSRTSCKSNKKKRKDKDNSPNLAGTADYKYLCRMIFYFSGTGNSQWAAETLASETGDTLVSIPDVLGSECRFELKSGEHVGFIFPIHGWRVPRIIREFLGRLSFGPGGGGTDGTMHYCFCLVTAGDSIGKAMERFQQQLISVPCGRLLKLEAVFSLVMPESYVGLPGMDVDTKEREAIKKMTAEEELKRFSKAVRAHLCGVEGKPWGWERLERGPIPSFFSGPVGGFFERFLITDTPFRVDSSRCVRCGICAGVCPVNDIKGGLGHEPDWLHNGKCLTCFSCYHHCPHHAIEYGQRTKNKGQYFYKRSRLHP